MDYEHLLVKREGRTAVVTLNRPDKLNALNAGLRADVLAVFGELGEDDDVWVIVVTGAGRGFCSGADVSGKLPAPPTAQNELLDELGWVGRQAMTIYNLDKPTIACMNGVAAGAGMSLALACDIRVGGPDARFRTVFAERGLSPDSGMSFFLPRIVGYSRAAELIFSSRDVTAEDAYRIGLLDRLVDGDPLEEAIALAAQITSWPPLAIRSGKRVLQHNMNVGLEDALRYEIAGLSFARKARNDAKEAMASFRDKRRPTYTGT